MTAISEFGKKGLEAEYDQVLTELKQRDYDDSHRAVARLSRRKTPLW